MPVQPRVLAIHDISCIGKCSLTVALPIISSVGIECAVLPTAVLSTHTGEFTGYTFRDLTEDIEPICNHWKSIGIKFDAIYTGYLGSVHQVELVHHILDEFGEGIPFICDPAMADSGHLYSNFDMSFVTEMRSLCSRADIIIPNLTEASLLLGTKYREEDYSEDYIRSTLDSLSRLGPKCVILSGVSLERDKLGAAFTDGGRFGYCACDKIGGFYHGTGDVFASAFVGAKVSGMSMDEAISAAVDFTWESIRLTYKAQTPTRFGVRFEKVLPDYAKRVLGCK